MNTTTPTTATSTPTTNTTADTWTPHPAYLIAVELTKVAGATWTASSIDATGFRLENEHGLALYLNARTDIHVWRVAPADLMDPTNPDGPRLRLYGHKRHDERWPAANIARAKTPAQVARDIARRVLAPLAPLVERVIDFANAEERRHQWTKTTLDRLQPLAPFTDRSEFKDHKWNRPGLRKWGHRSIELEADAYDQTITLKIQELPPDTAAAVLQALAN